MIGTVENSEKFKLRLDEKSDLMRVRRKLFNPKCGKIYIEKETSYDETNTSFVYNLVIIIVKLINERYTQALRLCTLINYDY